MDTFLIVIIWLINSLLFIALAMGFLNAYTIVRHGKTVFRWWGDRQAAKLAKFEPGHEPELKPGVEPVEPVASKSKYRRA